MTHSVTGPAPLLAPGALAELRAVCADYTVEAVEDALGLVGRAAHQRGDLTGAALALQRELGGGRPERTHTLVSLFLLGETVPDTDAQRAFGGALLAQLHAAGIVFHEGAQVRAGMDLRPYGGGSEPWWVVSDLGNDVRPGPLPADHVLGIGTAALTLAAAVPRERVGRALDLGTGCGVQALHLGEHATQVVATDIDPRALAMAATTAALSGQDWQLRAGSLLEPVAGERFDLVVANPPFVVSPGAGEDAGGDTVGLRTYRDSGLPGDEVCRRLVGDLPQVLAPGGTAVLLANWIVPPDGDWSSRLGGWLSGTGCDAWVWQREIADLGEYVALWLRDAGEQPGSGAWAAAYQGWLQWLTGAGAAAIGMGLVALRRHDSPGTPPIVVTEDVPQPLVPPVGRELPAWFARSRWLATVSDRDLLRARLRAAPDLIRTRDDLLQGDDGWAVVRERVRLPTGLCWDVEVDDAMAGVIAASDGTRPLGLVLDLAAAAAGHDGDLAPVAVPVVRDLVRRGILLPPG